MNNRKDKKNNAALSFLFHAFLFLVKIRGLPYPQCNCNYSVWSFGCFIQVAMNVVSGRDMEFVMRSGNIISF